MIKLKQLIKQQINKIDIMTQILKLSNKLVILYTQSLQFLQRYDVIKTFNVSNVVSNFYGCIFRYRFTVKSIDLISSLSSKKFYKYLQYSKTDGYGSIDIKYMAHRIISYYNNTTTRLCINTNKDVKTILDNIYYQHLKFLQRLKQELLK